MRTPEALTPIDRVKYGLTVGLAMVAGAIGVRGAAKEAGIDPVQDAYAASSGISTEPYEERDLQQECIWSITKDHIFPYDGSGEVNRSDIHKFKRHIPQMKSELEGYCESNIEYSARVFASAPRHPESGLRKMTKASTTKNFSNIENMRIIRGKTKMRGWFKPVVDDFPTPVDTTIVLNLKSQDYPDLNKKLIVGLEADNFAQE